MKATPFLTSGHILDQSAWNLCSMLKRAVHNSIFHWKYCTNDIKKPFSVSCIKNSSLTVNSSAYHRSLLSTNCLAFRKYLFRLYCENKSNIFSINQLRHSHIIGISTPEKRGSVSLNLQSITRNLSPQEVKEFTQDASGSNINGKMSVTENIQIFCLSKRNLISVSGDDSVNFLQGLITNDMNLFQTENNKALYSMILNVQGRVLYDIILYAVPTQSEGEDHFYLECDANVSADIVKFLKRYKIRKKVIITDLEGEFRTWASLSSPQQIQNCLSEEETRKITLCEQDPRVPSFGSRLILPHDTSFLSGNERDYHLKRYQLGIGEGIEDLPPGNCYPLECNLHFKHGVSFQKGCYIGQELTARTHHRGVVRKRLMPISFESIPEGLNSGEIITDTEGKNLGKFRNYKGIYGLALLRVGQALKANKTGMNIRDYKLKTQIPEWWPRHEI